MKMKIGHIAQACLLLVAAGSAMASSHREAPFITTAPKVDGTDFYMFNSYEAGKASNVTLIANYLPLQDAYGGPNYFSLDSNALYEIHVDNNGDGKEDLTFQFKFKNELANNGNGITLPIGGKNVAIPLRQAGAVTNSPNAPLSYTESFTLDVVRGDRRSGSRESVKTAGGGTTFGKPIDYIGTKTFPNNSYEGYANSYIQTINIPGCALPGKVFVGQRKEAFSVNLGVIFDLVNAPASFITNEANASAGGKFGEMADKNVTSLALEIPASCLTQGNEKVIGGWTTASLRQGRLLNGATMSGLQASEKAGGAWTQVSRLGMPLVNEVVIGLKDKDKFNGSKPLNDAANFADYVTNPTLPALIESLFGAKAPTNFPRTDLMTAFLTGLPTVNRPANITGLGVGGPLTEMLRLNTGIAATPAASQNSLGVAAGDNAGFPNGRRLGDDVVDVSLRVAMGALCVLTGNNDALKVGCKPADAPAGGVAFVDGVRASATDFQQVFPYLNTPLPGAK
ncbi:MULTISPECIES: DUF4331 domain-containing protein [unclassified Polaromonas]|uniref:DUF4331 domain-containing protein n=1 Tax=unclassified Polaromonas TaxID=2638319 RepID=UPI0018CA543F|nr:MULTISPECIES: DUF4331 domain-containing protein [unclassified Polaromonas]MBG6070415.1 hypothetical protein [Polaromonas sp. CG_9.7]MBG6112413.1 hypothetical protein [Polaromonas sp. CG_9.2]MDH6184060.1 hypothetical protein [Polaromonas sp. CG_23.6]